MYYGSQDKIFHISWDNYGVPNRLTSAIELSTLKSISIYIYSYSQHNFTRKKLRTSTSLFDKVDSLFFLVCQLKGISYNIWITLSMSTSPAKIYSPSIFISLSVKSGSNFEVQWRFTFRLRICLQNLLICYFYFVFHFRQFLPIFVSKIVSKSELKKRFIFHFFIISIYYVDPTIHIWVFVHLLKAFTKKA